MKTNIQVKALIMSVAAGILLSACGSGGGGGRRYNNQNVDVDPDTITWINPINNQQNVCRRTFFEVQVGDQRACSWNDVSDAFTLFSMSTGPDTPLDLTSAAPQQISQSLTAEGGCKFIFKPKMALLPNHKYGLAILETPVNSVGTRRDSVMFTTGDLLGSSCPADDQLFPVAMDGLPNQLQKTDIDQFGSVQGGEFVFDWDDFANSFGSTAISYLIGGFFGFNLIGTDPEINIYFNEAIHQNSAQNSIRIYELQSGWVPGMPLTNPISGVNVQVQGTSVVVTVGGSGLVPYSDYLLVVSRSLRSASGIYLNGSYFAPFSTGQ